MSPVDEELVRAILSEHDPLCELVRVDRPADGLVNRVLLLATTRGDRVLRIGADPSGDWKFAKEATLSAHLRTLGLPVPIVHEVDVSRLRVPVAYSLSERLPGQPWSRVFPSLTTGDNVRLSARLGDNLGRLHASTFDRFGDVVSTANGLDIGPVPELGPGPDGQAPGPFATWRELHGAFVDVRLRLMEDTDFEDLVEPTRIWFDRHATLLDIDVTPRLLHMDLHRGNILVHDGDISGIFDLEESIVGHNEYDLMRTELAHFRGQHPAFADTFFAAYGRHVGIDDGYAGRKEFYDVSRTLVWITSLIRHGDGYVLGNPDQSHLAARAHLLGLVGNAE